MKIFFFALLLLISFSGKLFSQNNQDSNKDNSTSMPTVEAELLYGFASFYANKFNGRQTANGEIYNSQKYTAACNRLPLNTWIKVTNIRNRKSVIVKINDRLQAKNKRLVDLSRIAAKELGYTGRGLTRVSVEVLRNYKP